NLACIELACDWLELIWGIIHEDFAIDFRSMHRGAAFKQQIAFLRGSFEQEIKFFPDQYFLFLFADRALNLHQMFAAPLDFASRNFVFDGIGTSSVLVRLAEGSHPVTFCRTHEFT